MTIIVAVLCGALLIVVTTSAYSAFCLHRIVRMTRGNAYFGRTRAERRAIKAYIEEHGAVARGVLSILGKVVRGRFVPVASYAGITAPSFKCSRATLERAFRFEPEDGDVFVATQMKCGTTWMQQIVYEILMHGHGNLGDDGHRHICAVSPWIESFDNVDIDDAPRLGRNGRRVIKTHLPASLCPYSARAKYVYVTRHPVSCFASTLDFSILLWGPLSPPPPRLLEIFCSRRMWWGPWPAHVAGWWEWSRRYSNVLFVRFEDMRADLPAVAAAVARFLGEDLSEAELGEVVRKSDFAYMKEREELFEMSPPTPFSVVGGFLKSGRADRYRDTDDATRRRIIEYCRRELEATGVPIAELYPDIVSA